jgi:hypothetical protein
VYPLFETDFGLCFSFGDDDAPLRRAVLKTASVLFSVPKQHVCFFQLRKQQAYDENSSLF